MVTAAATAHAQHGWTAEVPIRIAAYLPARSLGAVGAVEGRMRAAGLYGVGVEVRRRDSRFGARISFFNPFTAGAEFAPTPACAGSCQPYRDPYPIFQGLALDLTGRVHAGPALIQLAAGPGLRSYHVVSSGCDCGSPAANQVQPFGVDDRRIVKHLSGEVRWPLKAFDLGVQLEDYWGPFALTGRQQHDLVLSLGVHIR
jgi:hypothetical protein